MCLFVCVVDHGVNEGEPVNEQYCKQVNEDQYRDPSPSFYKHNLLACFTKLHMFCLLKTWLDSHPLICYNHSLTT